MFFFPKGDLWSREIQAEVSLNNGIDGNRGILSAVWATILNVLLLGNGESHATGGSGDCTRGYPAEFAQGCVEDVQVSRIGSDVTVDAVIYGRSAVSAWMRALHCGPCLAARVRVTFTGAVIKIVAHSSWFSLVSIIEVLDKGQSSNYRILEMTLPAGPEDIQEPILPQFVDACLNPRKHKIKQAQIISAGSAARKRLGDPVDKLCAHIRSATAKFGGAKRPVPVSRSSSGASFLSVFATGSAKFGGFPGRRIMASQWLLEDFCLTLLLGMQELSSLSLSQIEQICSYTLGMLGNQDYEQVTDSSDQHNEEAPAVVGSGSNRRRRSTVSLETAVAPSSQLSRRKSIATRKKSMFVPVSTQSNSSVQGGVIVSGASLLQDENLANADEMLASILLPSPEILNATVRFPTMREICWQWQCSQFLSMETACPEKFDFDRPPAPVANTFAELLDWCRAKIVMERKVYNDATKISSFVSQAAQRSSRTIPGDGSSSTAAVSKKKVKSRAIARRVKVSSMSGQHLEDSLSSALRAADSGREAPRPVSLVAKKGLTCSDISMPDDHCACKALSRGGSEFSSLGSLSSACLFVSCHAKGLIWQCDQQDTWFCPIDFEAGRLSEPTSSSVVQLPEVSNLLVLSATLSEPPLPQCLLLIDTSGKIFVFSVELKCVIATSKIPSCESVQYAVLTSCQASSSNAQSGSCDLILSFVSQSSPSVVGTCFLTVNMRHLRQWTEQSSVESMAKDSVVPSDEISDDSKSDSTGDLSDNGDSIPSGRKIADASCFFMGKTPLLFNQGLSIKAVLIVPVVFPSGVSDRSSISISTAKTRRLCFVGLTDGSVKVWDVSAAQSKSIRNTQAAQAAKESSATFRPLLQFSGQTEDVICSEVVGIAQVCPDSVAQTGLQLLVLHSGGGLRLWQLSPDLSSIKTAFQFDYTQLSWSPPSYGSKEIQLSSDLFKVTLFSSGCIGLQDANGSVLCWDLHKMQPIAGCSSLRESCMGVLSGSRSEQSLAVLLHWESQDAVKASRFFIRGDPNARSMAWTSGLSTDSSFSMSSSSALASQNPNAITEQESAEDSVSDAGDSVKDTCSSSSSTQQPSSGHHSPSIETAPAESGISEVQGAVIQSDDRRELLAADDTITNDIEHISSRKSSVPQVPVPSEGTPQRKSALKALRSRRKQVESTSSDSDSFESFGRNHVVVGQSQSPSSNYWMDEDSDDSKTKHVSRGSVPGPLHSSDWAHDKHHTPRSGKFFDSSFDSGQSDGSHSSSEDSFATVVTINNPSDTMNRNRRVAVSSPEVQSRNESVTSMKGSQRIAPSAEKVLNNGAKPRRHSPVKASDESMGDSSVHHSSSGRRLPRYGTKSSKSRRPIESHGATSRASSGARTNKQMSTPLLSKEDGDRNGLSAQQFHHKKTAPSAKKVPDNGAKPRRHSPDAASDGSMGDSSVHYSSSGRRLPKYGTRSSKSRPTELHGEASKSTRSGLKTSSGARTNKQSSILSDSFEFNAESVLGPRSYQYQSEDLPQANKASVSKRLMLSSAHQKVRNKGETSSFGSSQHGLDPSGLKHTRRNSIFRVPDIGKNNVKGQPMISALSDSSDGDSEESDNAQFYNLQESRHRSASRLQPANEFTLRTSNLMTSNSKFGSYHDQTHVRSNTRLRNPNHAVKPHAHQELLMSMPVTSSQRLVNAGQIGAMRSRKHESQSAGKSRTLVSSEAAKLVQERIRARSSLHTNSIH